MGCRHDLIDGWISSLWLLPDEVLEAISYHHTPSLAPKYCQKLAAILYISEYLLEDVCFENEDYESIISIQEQERCKSEFDFCVDFLGIDDQSVYHLADAVKHRYYQYQSIKQLT